MRNISLFRALKVLLIMPSTDNLITLVDPRTNLSDKMGNNLAAMIP